jgi:hypothetical protein
LGDVLGHWNREYEAIKNKIFLISANDVGYMVMVVVEFGGLGYIQ